MEMMLNLAGTKVTLALSAQTREVEPIVRLLYGDFFVLARRTEAEIRVSSLKIPEDRFLFDTAGRDSVFERLVPSAEVEEWLRKHPVYKEDFPFSHRTISSFCPGGLLLFNPETAGGHIYLFKQAIDNLHSLYRLLWIYFAQVLGEKGGCFLHAAALVKEEDGYLFMGDSGAGKSTIARFCPECFIFSDDAPIFLGHNGEYRVYPSPYHQLGPVKGLDKDVIQMNARVKGLYFLNKDNRAFLGTISKKKALSMILKRYIHFFTFLSAQAKSTIFDLFFEACDKLPTYNLHFRRDKDVLSIISRE